MSMATALRKLFTKPYGTVGPEQAHQLIDDRRAVLVDVREKAEWQGGHAPAARHIPLHQLAERGGELPADKPVITVCASGMRSARAAAMLARDGREVYNLRGGMAAWARAGLPLATGGRVRRR